MHHSWLPSHFQKRFEKHKVKCHTLQQVTGTAVAELFFLTEIHGVVNPTKKIIRSFLLPVTDSNQQLALPQDRDALWFIPAATQGMSQLPEELTLLKVYRTNGSLIRFILWSKCTAQPSKSTTTLFIKHCKDVHALRSPKVIPWWCTSKADHVFLLMFGMKQQWDDSLWLVVSMQYTNSYIWHETVNWQEAAKLEFGHLDGEHTAQFHSH